MRREGMETPPTCMDLVGGKAAGGTRDTKQIPPE